MAKVNVFEIKARLSEYLERAAGGERIVICRHNTPVAELRPVDAARTAERPIGPLPGRPTFEVPPSFFEPLTEEEVGLWDGSVTESTSVTLTGRPRGGSKIAETSVEYTRKRVRKPTRRRS
jgi:prevent-host-death family protein